MLTVKNIINYFVCVRSRGVFQGSALKSVFSVLFFLKCIKKIRGPYDISSFFAKKICFSVFLLNGIADKDSRFNSGVQFHLMVPLSFPFRIQI